MTSTGRPGPSCFGRDHVFHLARGGGGPDALPHPFLEDLAVPWDGPRTWAGAVLWEDAPPPEGWAERVYLGERMHPDLVDEEAYYREEQSGGEAAGLSVLRTTGPRLASWAPRLVVPEAALRQYLQGPEPPPIQDEEVRNWRRPRPVKELVPARAAAASRWWKRYEARKAACRTPAVGRQLYGSNGVQEYNSWAPCNLSGCGCRKNDVARRVRLIGARGLMTLTFKQEAGPLSRDEAWILAFPMMRKLFRWLSKRGIPIGKYVAVKECHQSGWCHVHVATQEFPHQWAVLKRRKRKDASTETFCAIDLVEIDGKRHRWRDAWVRLGGGFVVSWEELKNDGCYIAKYIDKANNWPREIRALVARHDARAWTSSTGLKAKKGESSWVHASGCTSEELERDLRHRVHKSVQKGLDPARKRAVCSK